MAVYEERRVRCDFCGCSAKAEPKRPPGWHTVHGFYGPVVDSCPHPGCVKELRAFCDENGFELPDLLSKPGECVPVELVPEGKKKARKG